MTFSINTSFLKNLAVSFVALALVVGSVAIPTTTKADEPMTQEEACEFLMDTLGVLSCEEDIIALTICPIAATLPTTDTLEFALSLYGMSLDDFGCGDDNNGGNDDEEACENDGGTWNSATDECEMPETPTTQCSDGLDNDQDGKTDSEDPGCTDGSDTDETDPSDNGGNGGNGGGNGSDDDDDDNGGSGKSGSSRSGSGSRGGSVAGASTSCNVPLLNGYVGLGKANNLVDVVRLELFLNVEMNANLPVNGVYEVADKNVVDQFQLKYNDEVLAPWVAFGLPNENTPTGYVYKTTKRMINNLNCADLNLPIPPLP